MKRLLGSLGIALVVSIGSLGSAAAATPSATPSSPTVACISTTVAPANALCGSVGEQFQSIAPAGTTEVRPHGYYRYDDTYVSSQSGVPFVVAGDDYGDKMFPPA